MVIDYYVELNIINYYIKTELGWAPQNNFKQALEKTVDWYVNNEKWWRPLKEKGV